MQFELTIDDFTAIQNALHYYKHVEKRGNFQKYDVVFCEQLRDKLSQQLVFNEEFNDGRPDGHPNPRNWFGFR